MIASETRFTFLVHSANGGGIGVTEPTPRHIIPVQDRAIRTAGPRGPAEDAPVAAVLHGLGKYSKRFAQRLRGISRGFDQSSADCFCVNVSFAPFRYAGGQR